MQAPLTALLSRNKGTELCYGSYTAQSAHLQLVYNTHVPNSHPCPQLLCMQAPLTALLSRNKLKSGDVDAVELLGGGSRVPKLQAALSEALGGRWVCWVVLCCTLLHPSCFVTTQRWGAQAAGSTVASTGWQVGVCLVALAFCSIQAVQAQSKVQQPAASGCTLVAPC